MAKNVEQNFANHVRFDPPFHFFLIPIFAITLVVAIVHVVRHPSLIAGWGVVFLAAVIVHAFKTRLYALKVQDRLIRLEERVRLASILPEPLRSRTIELSEPQLTALRFAPDSELSALVESALNNKWGNKQIKQSIRSWRADYFRV